MEDLTCKSELYRKLLCIVTYFCYSLFMFPLFYVTSGYIGPLPELMYNTQSFPEHTFSASKDHAPPTQQY